MCENRHKLIISMLTLLYGTMKQKNTQKSIYLVQRSTWKNKTKQQQQQQQQKQKISLLETYLRFQKFRLFRQFKILVESKQNLLPLSLSVLGYSSSKIKSSNKIRIHCYSRFLNIVTILTYACFGNGID